MDSIRHDSVIVIVTRDRLKGSWKSNGKWSNIGMPREMAIKMATQWHCIVQCISDGVRYFVLALSTTQDAKNAIVEVESLYLFTDNWATSDGLFKNIFCHEIFTYLFVRAVTWIINCFVLARAFKMFNYKLFQQKLGIIKLLKQNNFIIQY